MFYLLIALFALLVIAASFAAGAWYGRKFYKAAVTKLEAEVNLLKSIPNLQ